MQQGDKTLGTTQPNHASVVGIPRALSTRWVPRRKAQVVYAVRTGVLSLHEACTRYAMTAQEFRSWQKAMDKFGLPGLRATHALDYRQRKIGGRAGSA